MPAIFNKIDSAMRGFYLDSRTEAISPDLPPGVISYGERWVESVPLVLPGINATVVLRGKFDTAACFDDGSHALMDFKTSTPRAEHVDFYSRQLHGYAWAVENPAPGKFSIRQVNTLGLLAFDPSQYVQRKSRAYFGGGLHWINIPRNDADFLTFVEEVVTLLQQKKAPVGSASCVFCAYRDVARRTML